MASAVHGADDYVDGFQCTFEDGHVGSYQSGKFSEKPPSSLSLKIEAIDLAGQAAKLVLDSGAEGKLRIVRALNANHFLEVANEGFLNLTTVYDFDAEAGFYPAIHSRHFGILGQPVFSQYTGKCKALSEAEKP